MKFRRIFCALLAALLLCTAAAAAGYPDVSDTHWAGKQIAYLQDEIKGYPDGTFQPENTVTRGEFLTLFARIAFPDEWKQQSGEDWWKPAYEVCKAHELLNGITNISEAMPRYEIASILGRFCSGWDGVNESAAPDGRLVINWEEQRLESPDAQPLFSDTEKYERVSNSLQTCANQGLMNGYPDGSFKPEKGVTRAEAAAILARLKAQLALREKGCEYVCTVGKYWLMQRETEKTIGLALYKPYTGTLCRIVSSRSKVKSDTKGPLATNLLTGSDGVYVWGKAGLYQRKGDKLVQITEDPVFDFYWVGDNTLYYLSWDADQEAPTYSGAGMYYPCASQVKKLEISGEKTSVTLLASRDEKNFMQNLTEIYVENGKVYAAGSYFMGMADWHAALYEVTDGALTAVFGEY